MKRQHGGQGRHARHGGPVPHPCGQLARGDPRRACPWVPRAQGPAPSAPPTPLQLLVYSHATVTVTRRGAALEGSASQPGAGRHWRLGVGHEGQQPAERAGGIRTGPARTATPPQRARGAPRRPAPRHGTAVGGAQRYLAPRHREVHHAAQVRHVALPVEAKQPAEGVLPALPSQGRRHFGRPQRAALRTAGAGPPPPSPSQLPRWQRPARCGRSPAAPGGSSTSSWLIFPGPCRAVSLRQTPRPPPVLGLARAGRHGGSGPAAGAGLGQLRLRGPGVPGRG